MACTVMLVQPAYQRRVRAIAQTTVGPPLGLAWLAAVLRSQGVAIAVVDANALDLTLDQVADRVAAGQPALVGLTAVTPTIEACARLAGLVRARLPRVRIAIGGVHASALPVETLRNYPVFDVAVAGEGEPVIAALAQGAARAVAQDAVPTWPNLDGVYWRDPAGQVLGGGFSRVADLRHQPRPAWDLLPMARYHTPDGRRFAAVMAQRGCPAACSYCAVPVFMGQQVRRRDPTEVADELADLADRFGVRQVGFLDDTFTMDRGWVLELCAALVTNEVAVRVRWSCLTRVNAIDVPLLRSLYGAGCRRVELGVESGSPAVLKRLRKGTTVDQARAAFAAARQVGMPTMAFVMVNAPGETRDDLQATEALVRELDPDWLQVSFATPYPGTELRAAWLAQGLRLPQGWDGYSFLRDVAVDQPQLPAWEVRRAAWRMQLRHYARPAWLARQIGALLRGEGDARAFAAAATVGVRHLWATARALG
ncbi:MAG: cobalamin-dependent protein [Deltaproteobacteria bacterium]|nr:cobalamin-dependent protein [Deltaproteobacteria bacterium]